MSTPTHEEFRKSGMSGDAANYPLSPAAFRWICRFNGLVTEAQLKFVPPTWRYAPNAWCLADAEKWGAKSEAEQDERIKWSRRPGP